MKELINQLHHDVVSKLLYRFHWQFGYGEVEKFKRKLQRTNLALMIS